MFKIYTYNEEVANSFKFYEAKEKDRYLLVSDISEDYLECTLRDIFVDYEDGLKDCLEEYVDEIIKPTMTNWSYTPITFYEWLLDSTLDLLNYFDIVIIEQD
jgi:hypothetical protein